LKHLAVGEDRLHEAETGIRAVETLDAPGVVGGSHWKGSYSTQPYRYSAGQHPATDSIAVEAERHRELGEHFVVDDACGQRSTRGNCGLRACRARSINLKNVRVNAQMRFPRSASKRTGSAHRADAIFSLIARHDVERLIALLAGNNAAGIHPTTVRGQNAFRYGAACQTWSGPLGHFHQTF